MITNFIQLDFNKENDLKVPSVQYDSGSRFVKIKLQQNKVPFEINGYRVTVVANKVDGTEIMNDCTILDGANGLVEFEITEQFNAVEGVVDCQLKLFKDEILLTSMPFSISVVKSVSTKEIVSSNELKTLVNALGEVQNIDNRFAQTNAQLSRLENQVNPFTATLSISKSIAELGSSQDLTLNWSYNRDIKAQKINNDNLDISIRSKSYSNVSTSTTYTLTATSTLDLTTSKSVSITFTNGIYYGASSSTNYNSDLIKSLTKELSTNKSRTITVNASSSEYIYYCVPARLGECSFNVNGFEGGFDKVATVSFTNDFNYTENYFIYKSTNSNLGNTTVVVK